MKCQFIQLNTEYIKKFKFHNLKSNLWISIFYKERKNNNYLYVTIRRTCREYPIKVGAHPLARPLMPSSLTDTLNPLSTFLYFSGSTCKRHFTKSRGTTAVCVIPIEIKYNFLVLFTLAFCIVEYFSQKSIILFIL